MTPFVCTGPGGNGYVFDGTDEGSLYSALDRALADFKDEVTWKQVVVRNMSVDVSWQQSASRYLKLYQKVLQK